MRMSKSYKIINRISSRSDENRKSCVKWVIFTISNVAREASTKDRLQFSVHCTFYIFISFETYACRDKVKN